MSSSKPITRWNVLALAAAALGAVLTLLIDHWWIDRWINSGSFVPVGARSVVPLEPGRVLAYYESMEVVPRPGMAQIHVIAPTGSRLPIMPAYDDADYNMNRHGWSGRVLWEFHPPVAGLYDIGGFNNHYLSDYDIPTGDRIVINRSPELLSDAVLIRNTVRSVGISMTLLLVIGLYIPHVRAVRRMASVDLLANDELTDDELQELAPHPTSRPS